MATDDGLHAPISSAPDTGHRPSSTRSSIGRLRSNSVGLLGTIGVAVGPQAPTGGINLLPAIMAGIVGASAPKFRQRIQASEEFGPKWRQVAGEEPGQAASTAAIGTDS